MKYIVKGIKFIVKYWLHIGIIFTIISYAILNGNKILSTPLQIENLKCRIEIIEKLDLKNRIEKNENDNNNIKSILNDIKSYQKGNETLVKTIYDDVRDIKNYLINK